MDSDDEYLSDLTDASSPPASQHSRSPGPALALALKTKALPEPSAVTYPLNVLFSMIMRADIDLSPDYQRDFVWAPSKQVMLIDSLLNNYYIPPIIFSRITNAQGSYTWRCIDGKQRLSTLQRFFQGDFAYRAKGSKSAWYYTLPAGKRGNVFDQNLRRIFESKNITCMVYIDIQEENEREIFQRVQMGMALKKDEKWNALMGKHPDLVHRVVRTYVHGDTGLGSKLPWDTDRAKDFSCAAEAVCRLSYLPGTKGKAIETWLMEDVDSVSPALEALVDDVFRIFVVLANDRTHSKVFKTHSKVLAPIEFIMCTILIGMYKDQLSLAGLATAIDQMRREIRAAHKDVKNNERIRKTAYTFLAKKVNVPTATSMNAGGNIVASAAVKAMYAKRRRSESPDAPLAQQLYKRMRQGPGPATSSSQSQPTASSSQSQSQSQPEPSAFRMPPIPQLKSSQASQSPDSVATPPPPTPGSVSSVFAPEEDVKPVISTSSRSTSRPSLGFQITPRPRAQQETDLFTALRRAKESFQTPPAGLAGRTPLFPNRAGSSTSAVTKMEE